MGFYNSLLSVVWQNGEARYSTTLSSVSSVQSLLVHKSTHFHALYSTFASVVGLLCIAVIILISVWRFRRQRMLATDISRRHGGRRLISTYPQLQASGRRITHTTVTLPPVQATMTLPPPYSEAVASGPPPYSTIEHNSNKPVTTDPLTDADSGDIESLRQSSHDSYPSDSLLNQPV